MASSAFIRVYLWQIGLSVSVALFYLVGCGPIRQAVWDGKGVVPGESSASPDPSPAQADSTPSSGGKPPAQGGKSWEGEMEGIASWYGADFNGHLTASGEVYDMYAMTAAHKTLPLQTVVKVTEVDTGNSITVRINDRGPYIRGRVIDLSRKAARALGMRDQGVTRVKLEVIKWPVKSK